VRRTDGASVPLARLLLRLSACLAIAALAAPVGAEPGPEPGPDAAVTRSFKAYKSALERRDGTAAASMVSENSLAYYDRMRALALTAERQHLSVLEGTERMLVLSLRHSAPLELLKTASPAELVAYAVDEGLVSDTGIAKTELGEITLQGDRARCWIVIDGEPTRGVMQFVLEEAVLEEAVWKFDLEFAMRASEGLIAALAVQSGLSEDAVILTLLAQADGMPVDPRIWNPLVAEPLVGEPPVDP
jgi:hypothetical protein